MSNATLTATADALENALNTINNLRVYRDPPEQLAEFPCAMIYSRRGSLGNHHGAARNMHYMTVDVLSQRQNIQQAAQNIEPYLDLIQQAIWSDWTLGGVVDHVGDAEQQISYELVAFEYAGKPVFGYRLTIPIKVHRTIA